MIVVLDASVVVSAALKARGLPEQALLRAINAPDRLLVSAAIEREYRQVLMRSAFDRFVSAAQRQRILDLVLLVAEWIEPEVAVRECRDLTDDKYLALAAAGGGDAIVSGDADLLDMHTWRGVRILRPSQYLASGSGGGSAQWAC